MTNIINHEIPVLIQLSKQKELKVLESYTRDVARFNARIDYDTMDSIGVSTGQIVKIIGNNTSVAKVQPLYPSDEGKGIIRIDGMLRDNSGVHIGDSIKIEKIESKPCKSWKVKPLETVPPIDERYISDAMESCPMIVDQEFMVPYFGGRLKFKVVSVEPEGVVVIDSKSDCTIIEGVYNTELLEFNDILNTYNAKLVDEMRISIKDKKIENVAGLIEKINKLDYTIKSVNNILKGKTNETTMRLDGTLADVIEQALKNWIENKSERDKS